jgi:glycosyltransferase involved in cell wall biosynthesis
VLAVTSEPPWPLDSGGHLRTFHLLKALDARTRLRIVCPVQPHQQAAVAPLVAAGFDLRPVPVPARSPRTEASRVVEALLRGEPYVMYRRHAWPAAITAWREELRDANVLYLDHLDSFVYAPEPVDRPTVVDLHNVCSLLAQRASEEQSARWRRLWLRREARRLEQLERRIAGSGQALFAVSDSEANYLRRLGAAQVHAVPNGVDCRARADLPTGRSGPPVVMFLGTMSWGPNMSAARFLARTVFPALSQRVPGVSLLIVGRDPPADVRALHGGAITVTGSVPDVGPYLARASVLAVPLDTGGGTRLKILEAFAAGLPVVSTRVGAEGLAAEAGVHYVQAERPEFAAALADLLASPGQGARQAQAARALAGEMYDWHAIGDDAADHVLAIASHSADF